MREQIRVRGVTYRNPDEAYVAAEELEHHADTLAENLRRSGKEGDADTVQDRGHADAERLRTWARERQGVEADRTEQPADRPNEPARGEVPVRAHTRGGGRRRARSQPRARPRGRSRGGFTPRTRSVIAQTGIPSAASSATTLLLQVLGLTLGIAFLTLLLSRRGVQAFAELAGGAGHALDRIIEPVDPLAPRPKPPPPAVRGASRSAASFARSGAATRPRRPAPAMTFGGLALP
jgi:hypothetical protein